MKKMIFILCQLLATATAVWAAPKPLVAYTANTSAIVESYRHNGRELGMTSALPVSQNSGLQVSLTPNPATDAILISFTSEKEDNVTLKIYDLSGACLCNQDLGPGIKGTLLVPISELPQGLYTIELTSGGQKVTKQLVKE